MERDKSNHRLKEEYHPPRVIQTTKNMATIQRYIEVKPEVRKDIMKTLGITEGGLSFALSYKRDGEVSRRARELAIAQGGMAYCTIPECETIHDANGQMTQLFPNGAVLVIDKASSEGRLMYDGELVETYHGVTIRMLSDIQIKALSLSKK
jgi:hypothetical protein